MRARAEATIEDLYRVEGKAEIVNGEIVHTSPTGRLPGRAGDRICARLLDYELATESGEAVGDNKAFVVNLPNRRSFGPDAAYYTGGGDPMSGKFYEGAPVFAVEVRSDGDYGPAAERRMADKRADYFAAGTQVVWDVDVLREQVVRVYRASDPDNPTIYRRGDIAEAEPALPGWSMPVDDLFPKRPRSS
jgi:Uma2 family endonuclease